MLAALGLVGCERYSGPIGVQLERSGSAWLSPGHADGVQDTVGVAVRVSRPYESMVLTAYGIEVYDSEGKEVWRDGETKEPERWLGILPRPVAVKVPDKLTWDGKLAAGGIAEDGRYTIVVDVWDALRNTGRSGPVEVVVDNTPPKADLYVDNLVFTPDGDGKTDTIAIQQRNPSVETTWSGQIRDAALKTIRSWTWEGKTDTVVWDGRTADGVLAPDGAYSYVLSAKDQAGNASSFTVEGITLRTRPEIDTGTYIRPVYFQPFTSVWSEGLDPDILESNKASLDRAAALLQRFPELRVRVEGHAVRIHWDSPRLAPLEEKIVLMPLSRKRAEAVRDALVERGVAADRITTVAQGGARPLVPHGDLARRWQNRRAEFYFLEPPAPEPTAAEPADTAASAQPAPPAGDAVAPAAAAQEAAPASGPAATEAKPADAAASAH